MTDAAPAGEVALELFGERPVVSQKSSEASTREASFLLIEDDGRRRAKGPSLERIPGPGRLGVIAPHQVEDLGPEGNGPVHCP